MKTKKLLTRSKNKVFLGIIGGIADYFDFDPILARVIFIVLLVCTGFFPFGLVYFLTALVIPDVQSANYTHTVKNETTKNSEDMDK
jgi:phage shock protein C